MSGRLSLRELCHEFITSPAYLGIFQLKKHSVATMVRHCCDHFTKPTVHCINVEYNLRLFFHITTANFITVQILFHITTTNLITVQILFCHFHLSSEKQFSVVLPLILAHITPPLGRKCDLNGYFPELLNCD